MTVMHARTVVSRLPARVGKQIFLYNRGAAEPVIFVDCGTWHVVK